MSGMLGLLTAGFHLKLLRASNDRSRSAAIVLSYVYCAYDDMIKAFTAIDKVIIDICIVT